MGRGKMSKLAKRVLVGIVTVATGSLGFVSLYVSMQNEHAALTITQIGFEPFPLVADERELLVISFKNTGHNYAVIDSAATDRVKGKLPDKPIYDPANVVPKRIAGGEELQLISDVGDKVLTFTQSEINSLKAGNTQFKIVGFLKYIDQKHPWILGGGVLQFCYVWDVKVGDDFSACSERQYTNQYEFLFFDGLKVREFPLVTIGTQTVSPITMSPKVPDPKYSIPKIEIRPRK
jgi:hypothetical protein